MVPRYSRKEMVEIWSDVSKYSIWLDIEIHALEGMEKVGIVPVGTAKVVKKKAKFDSERIDEIEAEIKHDVLAFLTNISESVGPEARFIHQGMTSSDVLDTCLNIQLKRAGELLLKDMDLLLSSIKYIPLLYPSVSIILIGLRSNCLNCFGFGSPAETTYLMR